MCIKFGIPSLFSCDSELVSVVLGGVHSVTSEVLSVTLVLAIATRGRVGWWCGASVLWGYVLLYNSLVAPPCKGVTNWTELYHLLQKYYCPLVIYSSIIQILC